MFMVSIYPRGMTSLDRTANDGWPAPSQPGLVQTCSALRSFTVPETDDIKA